MAILQYQVFMLTQWASFNASESPFFDPITAGRLIALGIAKAVGSPPPAIQVPSGAPVGDIVDDSGLPTPTSAADSSVLQAQAGVLPNS